MEPILALLLVGALIVALLLILENSRLEKQLSELKPSGTAHTVRSYIIWRYHLPEPTVVLATNSFIENGWLWVVDAQGNDVVAYPAETIGAVVVSESQP